MKRIVAVILAATAVVALPFLFRRDQPATARERGDEVTLIIITPHNKAIREEFGAAFKRWYSDSYGVNVEVDWRSLGGTTEIMRYLESEFTGSMRSWWERQGGRWPGAGAQAMYDPGFTSASNGVAAAGMGAIHQAFRDNDSSEIATARIDLFFGGGVYDHEKAERMGLTVPAWESGKEPIGIFKDDSGNVMIPVSRSGEVWRGAAFYGTVLSTFGICYNPERLADLGIEDAPRTWADLTDPRYFAQVGVTDPTKSGSVAKAFEMIIQQSCWEAVAAAGFSRAEALEWEEMIGAARLAPGKLPEGVPAAYQEAMASGWLAGINRIRLIAANARYFTDAAGKVPIDVSMGATAAGIAIDFFGRFQEEYTRAADGSSRMVYITPAGGSSVSADPISLLRGAPNRELAERFIEFCLGEEGQKLWNYRVGTPGGPESFALRRLPIRRDYYPPGDDATNLVSRAEGHARYTSDELTAPEVDPYRIAQEFTYVPRWTARHFGIHRDLIRAICIDSGEELRGAWRAIISSKNVHGGEEALELLEHLPQKPAPVTWESLIDGSYKDISRLDYLRIWTGEMRTVYRQARYRVR